MMLMLQNRCRDTTKAINPSDKSDGSEKGSQALYLLSEVAMGNSGTNEDEREEKRERDVAENGPRFNQYLPNVLVKKLLDTNDEEAKTESWFEELMQGFS